MKALSVRAPWWWFILHLNKPVENRDWYTSYRGPVLLHASRWFQREGILQDWDDGLRMYEMACQLDGIRRKPLTGVPVQEMRELGGHIVGKVDIVDCVAASSSPWFVGRYGFVLQNPVVFDEPFPVKGSLGLFDVAYQDVNVPPPLFAGMGA